MLSPSVMYTIVKTSLSVSKTDIDKVLEHVTSLNNPSTTWHGPMLENEGHFVLYCITTKKPHVSWISETGNGPYLIVHRPAASLILNAVKPYGLFNLSKYQGVLFVSTSGCLDTITYTLLQNKKERIICTLCGGVETMQHIQLAGTMTETSVRMNTLLSMHNKESYVQTRDVTYVIM